MALPSGRPAGRMGIGPRPARLTRLALARLAHPARLALAGAA